MRAGTDAQRALTVRTCAGWLTPARPGRFPLVLIGSGMAGRAYYHAQLAEDVANAGFVVAFVSGLGPTPEATLGFDAGSVDTLKVDAVQALGALGADVRVDPTRVGLVGWSAAGVVQLAIARDAPGIRAAVSLDSGVGYDYGPRLWASVAGGPPRTMPYLHLAAGVRSPVPTDDSLLTQVGADIRVMGALSHAQFTDLPLGSGADTRVAHAAMRRTVVDFLLAQVAR
jgi:dienelactone hydrolase